MADTEQTPALPDEVMDVARREAHRVRDIWRRDLRADPDAVDSMMTRAAEDAVRAVLAGRTVLELPVGVESDGMAYFASPAEDDDVVAEVDADGQPMITDGIRVFDDCGAESHALALLGAVRAGRRLASEPSGDGESGE